MKGKRILYVLVSESLQTSVGKKVLAQIEALNELGYDCKGLFVSFEAEPEEKPSNIIWHRVQKPDSKFFVEHAFRAVLRNAAIDFLYAHEKDFDLFYIRHSGSHRELNKWMRTHGKKTIIEIQTDGYGEIFAVLPGIKRGTIVSTGFSFLQYFLLPWFNEFKYLRGCLKRAVAVVTVTDELRKRLLRYNRHVHTMANGYDENRMQSRPVPAYDGVSLKLIFLKGNSHELGYDGLDRVINSIAISKYRDNIHFKIIGSISERERSIYEKFEFVELKGFLTGKSLEQEIIEAHAGIATMSLYRNKVQEASALKVREYFSKGLPFLYGYKDSDIDRFPEMQKYCLRFPNDDSLLDMELIKKFLDDFYQHPERIDEMVDVAKRHLSWKIKMGETMKFVESARNENATAQSNLPS